MLRSRPIPRPTRAVAVTAALAVGAVSAAACSGNDAAPPATTAPTTAPTSTTIDPDNPTIDGVLRIGVLVPETGGQAALGPALRTAAQAAADDVNEAGGVLEQPVELVFGDAGDATTDTAGASVDTFAGRKVDVIIGPPSSGVTSLVLDKVARSTAALVSPGNPVATAPTDVPYLQLAPGLELLGTAVGRHVATNGLPTALVVARDDPFGQRVSAAVAETLEAEGVTVTVQAYNPESDVYSADVTAALAAGPAQVVLVGYAELAEFLSGFIAQGVLPAALPTTVVTDRLDDALFRRFSPPVLQGLQAVAPASAVAATGATATGATATGGSGDDATSGPFAAEVYDAVAVVSLAAARAGSDGPKALHAAARSVTGGDAAGDDGESCADIASCLRAAAGGSLTYEGQAGPYRLDGDGVATEALFAAFTVGADNTLAGATVTTFRAQRG